MQTIRQVAPSAVVIIDAKRGDIGSTNDGYVEAIFDRLGADATTVSPYLGRESLTAFAARTEKLSFVLCRTSNKGAAEFQDLVLENGQRLFEYVATQVANAWNQDDNFGLVVGATSPEELRLVREQVPDMPLLVPGVGAQGGDPATVARALKTGSPPKVLINASRSILYASKGENFAEAARAAAENLSAVLARGLE